MKTLILPDIHGQTEWKDIVNAHSDADKVIFLGDYFDSFNISGLDQIVNFKDIIEYKETGKTNVIMLIGNHDYHYFQDIGYTGTSGYQAGVAPNITQIIEENRHHLQMAYSFDGFLFTHAGVSPVFMNQVFSKNKWKVNNVANDLNELWKHKPKSFGFNGYESSGDNVCQTPIWIRPKSLMYSNKSANPKYNLNKIYIQIVGHTNMDQIDNKNNGYWFVDTLQTSKEYLTIKDEIVKINKL